jgi:peptidoglycan LD-endopeptidase CwlK
MPEFSKRSLYKLSTCDNKLQDIMNEVIKYLDISIISGYRSAIEQDSLYERGVSKVKFPYSKHNVKPSQAVDIMLWNKSLPHIRWYDREQMCLVAGFVLGIAKLKKINLKWGGDWDNNKMMNDNWFDGGHFEIEE